MAGETLSRNLSPSSSLQAQASFTSNSASSMSPGSSNSYGTRHRASHLISGIWITFEVVVTVSQIIASIIVLFVSRDEKPEAPLAAWIAGYAAGCLVSLPLLYWRYKYRNVRSREQDALAPPLTSSPTTPTGAAEQTSYLSMTPEQQDEESQAERQRSLNGDATGWDRYVEGLFYFSLSIPDLLLSHFPLWICAFFFGTVTICNAQLMTISCVFIAYIAPLLHISQVLTPNENGHWLPMEFLSFSGMSYLYLKSFSMVDITETDVCYGDLKNWMGTVVW